MRYIVFNVYVWGREEQARLLTDCLGPALTDLWMAGMLRRFWFGRFDHRGPHVMLLLGSPPDSMRAVRECLEVRLDRYLAAFPSNCELSLEELTERDAACRYTLSPINALPGLAVNNSYASAEDAAAGYLFGLATDIADQAALNRSLARLAFWSIDQVREGTAVAAAVEWFAAFGAAVERAGADPSGYWRYYASTLFLGDIRNRIRDSDPHVVAGLPRLIGSRNLSVLSRVWDRVEHSGSDCPGVDELARLAVGGGSAERSPRARFVREVTHGLLAQLGHYVPFCAPLALYAWDRTRSAEAATPAPVRREQ